MMIKLFFIATVFTKAVIGGWIGFLTNDLAIKMLFKRKFGLGGIIPKTRLEFIENASQLVETDIFNETVLQKEVQSTSFKTGVENFLISFLKEDLINVLGDDFKVGDLLDSEESVDHLIQMFTDERIGRIFKVFFEAFTQSSSTPLFSPRDWVNGTTVVVDHLFRFLNSKEGKSNLEACLLELTKIVEREKPFCSIAIQKALQNTMVEAVDTLKSLLQSEQILEKIPQIMKREKMIPRIAHLIFSEIKGDSVSTYFQIETFQAILEGILKNLSSEKGESFEARVLTKLIDVILNQVGKMDQTFFELLPDAIEKECEAFILCQLSALIKDILVWLENSRDHVEVMINQSFSDQLLLARIIQQLGLNLAELLNIVDLVKDYTEHKIDLNHLAMRLSQQVIEFLKSTSVKDLFSLIETRGERGSNALVKSLQRRIKAALKGGKLFDLRSFSMQPIESWGSENQLSAVLETVAVKGAESVLSFFEIEGNTSWIATRLRRGVIRKGAGVLHLLGKREIGKTQSGIRKGMIRGGQEVLKSSFFKTFIIKRGRSLKWDDIAQSVLRKQKKKILSSRPIQGLQKIFQTSYFYTGIEQVGDTLRGLMPSMAGGGVKQISSANLKKFSPDQVSALAEAFIGKELKPITFFGAGLGLLLGVILPFIPKVEHYLSIESPWQYLFTILFSGGLFGLIGWGTNWLALKMIFRPYHPLTIFGKRVPLTPGVIAQNKERFAEKMGDFVEENLLKKESIEQLFIENKARLADQLYAHLSSRKFRFLNYLVKKNRYRISDEIFQWVIMLVHRDGIFTDLQTWMESIKLQDLGVDKALGEKVDGGDLGNFLIQTALKLKSEGGKQPIFENLGKQCVPYLQQVISSFLAGSRDTSESTSPYLAFLIKKILSALKEVDPKIWKKEIFDFIISDFEKLGEKNSFSSQIFNALLHEVQTWVERYLRQDRPISEILDGKLIQFLRERISELSQYIIRVGLVYFKRHHYEIAAKVYDSIYEASDFLTQQGLKVFKDEFFSIVQDLLIEKLPTFLLSETDQIESIVDCQVERIGACHIGEAGIVMGDRGIENLFKFAVQSTKVKRILGFLMNRGKSYVMEASYFSFRKTLKRIQLDSLFTTLKVRLTTFFTKELDQKKHCLTSGILLFVQKWGDAFGHQFTYEKLFYHLPSKQIEGAIRKGNRCLQSTLKQGAAGRTIITSFFEQLGEVKFSALFRVNKILNSIKAVVCRELQDKTSSFSHEVKYFLRWGVMGLPQAIEPKTKEDILAQGINAVLQSLKTHLRPLLGGLDFRSIVVHQVKIMSPKAVERMFYKFAGRYFVNLINYGFLFGLIFGAVTEAALVLFYLFNFF